MANKILLINPKNAFNIGNTIRNASCFWPLFDEVIWTGDRVQHPDNWPEKARLPRQERMKGFQNIKMTHNPNYRVKDNGLYNIAVELMPDSENLFEVEFQLDNCLLIFGPEDGNIPRTLLQHCYKFIQIPSLHCFNLASAATIVISKFAEQSGLFGGQASQYVMESEVRSR